MDTKTEHSVRTVETRDELDDVLATADRVLVMVRTTGCTICKSMEPILDIAAKATDAAVVVFNPETDLDAVEAFDVRSVPTFLLFGDGDLIDRRADGFVPAEELIEFTETGLESRV
ncbi:thioredoxin family protein [Haloarcula japonica]|uniref:Thioredoxin n=1 Tax=Haloarcula japonica (strain ATCC 49778 / DSM 6131 / JCM 7785 / NBRC 101032 / NCIMB 13157 / TR-1) TaxID=1227453 RepID=M0LMJ2_HALJT|nr:thioredoxin family protein [Haloarcula japonica]EMA34318.1 thioredoxin [Haloarcula japonica DSM 6131]